MLSCLSWNVKVEARLLCRSLFSTDECFDEIHECDSLATCHNTDGNYTCQCPDGYLTQWKDCIGKGCRN